MDLEEKNNSFEDLNIFNEITQNTNIKDNVNQEKYKNNLYDHLLVYTKVFKIFSYILFIVIILSSIYIYIQKSENFYEHPYLNLFCPLFLGKDVSDYISGKNCSSIITYNTKIINDINKTRQDQFNVILEQIPKIYELTSSNSKEKAFLLTKSKERLKILNIIEEFEKMKNEYSYIDKDKIICKDISIDSKNVFKANCEAYSSYWDDDIIGYDGAKKVNGTSISVAMSFLNYIQTKSSKFMLINKQKTFSQESTNVGFYIYKTGFTLEMKYNNGYNLSF